MGSSRNISMSLAAEYAYMLRLEPRPPGGHYHGEVGNSRTMVEVT